MTDKELFEKVEKKFLPEKAIKIERFNKTKFKKVINEIKGPQAPGANVGGFLSRAAAAIPGTRGYRMRSAEARKQEALARQEELKAQQAEKDLKYGVKGDTPTDPVRKQRYENDARYKRVWDAYKQGKERDVSASDIDYYNKIEADINKGTIDKAAEEKLRNKAIADIDDLIKQKAPQAAKALLGKRDQKDNFIKFMLGDQLSQDILKPIALTITNAVQYSKEELAGIKDVIDKNGKASDGDKELFISDLPLKAIANPTTGKPKPNTARINKLLKRVKDRAERNGMEFPEMLKVLNKKAAEYKIDTIVNKKQGDKVFKGQYEVLDHELKTGTVIIKGIKKPGMKSEPKTEYVFPDRIQGLQQVDFIQKESFEQIIKRYR